ncbi:gluconokinase [Carnobacterium sp.]|uniref:gluconokinase n=1 Tax=Carnobacterium sp. TaxID=48221 RepID=UPI003C7360BD
MQKKYVIGVDIGTTSTKAVLFKQNGEAVATSYEAYPLFRDTPAMAEQNPDSLFQAVLKSIKLVMKKAAICPDRILCVSFSSAMHSLIAMDENDKPLTRSITWADNRAAEYAEKLKKAEGLSIYHRTGTPIHPMSPLTKLIWLREEHAELFNKAKKFIGIKEYIFFQLFGRYMIDYSVASSTGLFNIRDFKWDDSALTIAKITENGLSELVSPTEKLIGMVPKYATQMGLLPETPFVIGGSDGCLSNLGVGAVKPGEAVVTIGTSGAIRMVTKEPFTDPEGKTFCYVLDEQHWVIGGAVNNGGNILEWASKTYLSKELSSYSRYMDELKKVPAGSLGLFFHPYLNGERAPLWNAEASGSFFGINMMHRPEHFMRAVVEGISFNLYAVLMDLSKLAGPPKRITATGGFSRSPVWRQLLSDVFDYPLEFPESIESSCLGAAVIGLKSMNVMNEITEIELMNVLTYLHKPQLQEAQVYKRMFPVYKQLSQTFAVAYHQVSEFKQTIE